MVNGNFVILKIARLGAHFWIHLFLILSLVFFLLSQTLDKHRPRMLLHFSIRLTWDLFLAPALALEVHKMLTTQGHPA